MNNLENLKIVEQEMQSVFKQHKKLEPKAKKINEKIDEIDESIKKLKKNISELNAKRYKLRKELNEFDSLTKKIESFNELKSFVLNNSNENVAVENEIDEKENQINDTDLFDNFDSFGK